jgi:hypothetical protein
MQLVIYTFSVQLCLCLIETLAPPKDKLQNIPFCILIIPADSVSVLSHEFT